MRLGDQAVLVAAAETGAKRARRIEVCEGVRAQAIDRAEAVVLTCHHGELDTLQEDCMAPLQFGLSVRAIPEPSASSHQKIEPDHDQRAERNADEDAQCGIKHAS